MELLNDVLGASRDPEPPMRDIEGSIIAVRLRRAPTLHTRRRSVRMTPRLMRPASPHPINCYSLDLMKHSWPS